MSYLQEKSEALQKAAQLLHDNSCYPAVAHSAYYSCVQLMKHILLHALHNTETKLKKERIEHNRQVRRENGKELGTHEFFINKVGGYIKSYPHQRSRNDFRIFNSNIWQLRDLRVNADYHDAPFNGEKSVCSLDLSNKIATVLKKY
jgi:hypothetical protein